METTEDATLPVQPELGPEPEQEAPKEAKQEAKREFLELVKMVVVFLVVFWGIKTFVLEGYEVLGPSMLPNLHDQERILVLKLPHQLSRLPFLGGWQPFKQGDIIVFDGVDNKRYVKRLIAVHPEHRRNTVAAKGKDDAGLSENTVKVEYDRGRVRVNNWQIDESPYLLPEEMSSPDRDACVLHPGEYYVLGDHRSVSKDSRSFRAINDDQIVGRAVLRFWPLGKFGLL